MLRRSLRCRSIRWHHHITFVAAVVSVALATTGVPAGAGTASAEPIKVMVIGDLTSQSLGFTVPEIVPSAKAALKTVKNVEILTCDSKGDAAVGEACGKKAVDAQVDAVILGFGQGMGDALAAAGIPVVGNPPNATAPNSFPTISSFALYAANGVALAKSGCKKLGILYLDGTDFLVNYVKAGAESAGAKEVARAPIPANAPDLTPAVAKLTGAGAQCIALSVIPAQVVQAVTAVNQTGKRLQMAAVSAIMTKEVRDSLGELSNGIIIVDNQLNPEDRSPAIKKVTKRIKAVDPAADITQVGLVAYIGGRLLAAAIPQVQGDVTPASLTAALNGLRDTPVDGLIHPYSAVELTNPSFKRFFNHYGISYKIVNGRPKAQTGFFDLADVLDSVS